MTGRLDLTTTWSIKKYFQFIRPQKTDILIFDSLGGNWITSCIPKSATYQYVTYRSTIPVVFSLRFFVLFLFSLYQKRPKTRTAIRLLYFHNIVTYLSPQIILTFSDNSEFILDYVSSEPRPKVVLIQNGMRKKTKAPFSYSRVPIYFTFGQIEKRRLNNSRYNCDALLPNGSLALGCALEFSDKTQIARADICFISSYRQGRNRHEMSLVLPELAKVHRDIFLMTFAFTKCRGTTLRIITKSTSPEEQLFEFDYFSELAGTNELDFITSDRSSGEFNSYYGAISSDLVVCCHSTLGFEMFSMGKKVIFGSSISPQLISERGMDDYFSELPLEVKIENNLEPAFIAKLTQLLVLTESKYKSLIKLPSYTLLSMPENNLPQEVIQKYLLELLINSTH